MCTRSLSLSPSLSLSLPPSLPPLLSLSPLPQHALLELAARISRPSKEDPNQTNLPILDGIHQHLREGVLVLLQEALNGVEDLASVMVDGKLELVALGWSEVGVLPETVLAALNEGFLGSLYN